MVLSRANRVPTIVFDEVDAGVGGATAAAVADRLFRLAETAQVLVVTHSPQVAARGITHLRVQKTVTRQNGADSTTTAIAALSPDERREEIARMLAGATVTAEARAAADRLLDAGYQDIEKGIADGMRIAKAGSNGATTRRTRRP